MVGHGSRTLISDGMDGDELDLKSRGVFGLSLIAGVGVCTVYHFFFFFLKNH